MNPGDLPPISPDETALPAPFASLRGWLGQHATQPLQPPRPLQATSLTGAEEDRLSPALTPEARARLFGEPDSTEQPRRLGDTMEYPEMNARLEILFAEMQQPDVQAATIRGFHATPEQMGQAAVAAARRAAVEGQSATRLPGIPPVRSPEEIE